MSKNELAGSEMAKNAPAFIPPTEPTPEGQAESIRAQIEQAVPAPAAPTNPHVAGINALRATDPQARVMWSVKGPKDEPDSKISQVLMRVGDQGRVFVILSSNAFGFTVYLEAALQAPAPENADLTVPE